MDDDDNICLCFRVSKRKVIQYLRVEKPRVASQLSQCYGAGMGCGWCRPFLEKLFNDANPESVDLPNPVVYADQRRLYRKKNHES